MRHTAVGTCIPGAVFESWAPALVDKGFECFAICFHMGFGGVDIAALAPKVRALFDGRDAFISALGFYGNPLENDEHRRALEACIDQAGALGAGVVSAFAGALEGQSVEAALPAFKRVFGALSRRAEDRGVKLAIENCPMGGTWHRATCNIGFNARAWEMMFSEVQSDALGLEWEPAHQMMQLVDPIANLRAFASKVHHVHGKDAAVKRDLIARHGIIGPEDPVDARFPGLGDTDWRQIFALLQGAGYTGAVSIEGYHDVLFSGDWEMTGQMHALEYLKWCRGGAFVPNPWQG